MSESTVAEITKSLPENFRLISHDELYAMKVVPDDLLVIDIKDTNDDWGPSTHQGKAVDKVLLLHHDLRYATRSPRAEGPTDSEMLDWLEGRQFAHIRKSHPSDGLTWLDDGQIHRKSTLRDAITDAMKGNQP